MNLLQSVETTIANLLEGAFGRIFRSEVRPMELARKLAREMDEHRTVSVSRVYAPNEYSVWLSPQDRARYEGVEQEVLDELGAYLLEHARREDLILTSSPLIAFHTDERLALGEFGIQARSVRPRGHSEEGDGHELLDPQPAQEHGQTMIYSTSRRLGGQVMRTASAPPVDEHAVGRAEILDRPAIRGGAHLRVTPGDSDVVEDYVAVAASPDRRPRVGEEQAAGPHREQRAGRAAHGVGLFHLPAETP